LVFLLSWRGPSINVDGASLPDLSAYKKGNSAAPANPTCSGVLMLTQIDNIEGAAARAYTADFAQFPARGCGPVICANAGKVVEMGCRDLYPRPSSPLPQGLASAQGSPRLDAQILFQGGVAALADGQQSAYDQQGVAGSLLNLQRGLGEAAMLVSAVRSRRQPAKMRQTL